MRNIKLVIEYEGTNYAGWQEQRAKGPFAKEASPPTIQAHLREAIQKVAGEWVVLYAASRTDAGVHALEQVVNFKTSSYIPVEKLAPAINFYLPKEIVVRSAEEVPEDFHAQFDAKSKVYKYTVLNDPIPRALDRNFSYRFPWSLDIEKMKQAASYLPGSHDFRSFSVESLPKKDSTRNIKSFEITQEDRYIHFVVEADGFLHKMIRGIVGTLLMVGSGKLAVEEFRRILQAKDRRLAGPTVPARGLCLLKVKYDEEKS